MKLTAALLLLSVALLALLAAAAAQAPVALTSETSAAAVPAPAENALQVAPILAEASEASNRLVADRAVSTRKNRGGGKVTLISNKNLLTHIASAPKQVNHFELEEQDKKQQVEQDTKAAAMKERQRAQEEHEKKVAAEEQAAKNALEEKAKKEKAEQAEKVQAEENTKAQARLTEQKAKADEALAKAKAEESSVEESSDEDGERKKRKKKDDDDDDDGEGRSGRRRRRGRGRRGRGRRGRGRRGRGRRRSSALNMVGYSPYGEPYSPGRVESAGGLCVVRGLVNRQSSDHIATLPSRCYPRDGRLIFNLFHNADVRVDVLPDGRIFYVAGSIAASWLSLNGITFAPRATQGVQMYNNWQPYGSGYRNTVQSKHGKLCVLSGLIRSGGWGAFAQMRSDCNPSGGQLIFSCNNHGSVTRVDVNTGGTVHYAGGSANHGWVSLDGIVYTPNQGGREISLQSGWGNYYNGYRTARYERTGPWCALSGLIRGSWGGFIGRLPKKCRPIKRLIFNANVHEWSARVDVLPNGEVHYISRNGNHGWMSLSNIHFAVRK